VIGLGFSLYMLRQINVRAFKQEVERMPEPSQVFASAMD